MGTWIFGKAFLAAHDPKLLTKGELGCVPRACSPLARAPPRSQGSPSPPPPTGLLTHRPPGLEAAVPPFRGQKLSVSHQAHAPKPRPSNAGDE